MAQGKPYYRGGVMACVINFCNQCNYTGAEIIRTSNEFTGEPEKQCPKCKSADVFHEFDEEGMHDEL